MTIKERIKRMDEKVILRWLTLIIGTAFIVVVTMLDIGLDPDKFNINDYFVRVGMIMACAIFGLLMGESSGLDGQKKKENGLFQTNLGKYRKKKQELEDNGSIIYFDQYFEQRSQIELQKKEEQYLVSKGFKLSVAKDVIKFVNENNIEEVLSHPIKVGDSVIDKISGEDKVKAVKDVVFGKVKLETNSAIDYLGEFDTYEVGTELEIGKKLDKNESFMKMFTKWTKIGSTLAFATLWGLLSVKEWQDGSETQAMANLFTRIFNLVGGFFSGWLSAVIVVGIQASKLGHKASVLTDFQIKMRIGEFVPKHYSETAKEHFAEYVNSLAVIGEPSTQREMAETDKGEEQCLQN